MYNDQKSGVTIPYSLKPIISVPLDSRYYFDSLTEAQAAAANAVTKGEPGSNYFIGETLVVVDSTASEAVLYIIQPNKTLAPAGLPQVTTDDNNKFLTVVNGKWTATSLTEWGGGEF